jgi:hypothetical protein
MLGLDVGARFEWAVPTRQVGCVKVALQGDKNIKRDLDHKILYVLGDF